MWLLLVFVAVPLVEIALFIQIGGLIGLWPTLAIVVLTALAGTTLMRAQGRLAVQQLRAAFDEFRDPSEPLVHGAMILFAGALLLTPGFFTDTVGFLLLMPPVRRWAYEALRTRVKVQDIGRTRPGEPPGPGHTSRPGESHGSRARGDVVEGEFEDVTEKRPTHTTSGWTRH